MKLTYKKDPIGGYCVMRGGVEITHIDNREYLRSGYWGKFHFSLNGVAYNFGTLREAKTRLEILLTTQGK